MIWVCGCGELSSLDGGIYMCVCVCVLQGGVDPMVPSSAAL